MPIGPSILLALGLIALILLFAAREWAAYRRDGTESCELYPYTGARLARRLMVTGCLISEVILLTLVRFTLSPAKPFWFLVYVAVVLSLVLFMVVLSILDLRESVRLRKWSLERLRKEFLYELGQGRLPPERH